MKLLKDRQTSRGPKVPAEPTVPAEHAPAQRLKSVKPDSISEPGQISPAVSSIRLIRMPEVLALTGLSRSTIHRLRPDADFPRAVKITKTAIAFYEHEILEWIQSRKRA